MRDAFYGAADPSLVEGAMSRDFSGETFEMRYENNKNKLCRGLIIVFVDELQRVHYMLNHMKISEQLTVQHQCMFI